MRFRKREMQEWLDQRGVPYDARTDLKQDLLVKIKAVCAVTVYKPTF